ncbi:glutamine amidotransferase [Paenibacillus doosanensis]|uniref:glutamine amidotransferase n=1 Tax=Paenibacillus doosanensis TaxID=1229154 RepID=UPI00218008FF|nr:glutamine amidotransferase [Paenibacillus doosanensis]MCS7464534.1 glutamine amidotransferase [Paenibacillus doosanensis]
MKILFIGESWVVHMIHTKGYDSFTSTKYEEGATYLLSCLRERGIDVTYMPSHEVQVRFPRTLEELKAYDAIVLSDVGANTFLLQNPTFYQMQIIPDALEHIRQFVAEGGGLLMIGGYLTFMGIEGKANYKRTVLADVLPVVMTDGDDRVEMPSGFAPSVSGSHPLVDGLGEWPKLLGYNKLSAKLDAEELLCHDGDAILTVGTYGQGKTAAFASDCSPHWGSLEFMNWEHYPAFWSNLIHYLK